MSSGTNAPQPPAAQDPTDPPPAFYLPLGDGAYRATLATQSPWDPRCQHGGPPTALLAAAVSAHDPQPGLRIGRLTVDFLSPIPLADVAVRVRTLRPGRRIRLVEADLVHEGETVVSARAWQLAAGPADGPVTEPVTAPPLPAAADTGGLTRLMGGFGYGRATEWRPTSGAGFGKGPSAAWTRPLVPLVEGRPTAGLERLLVVADSANGISLELPLDSWLSIPPGIGVTVLREPADEWLHMSARTHLSGDGTGLAHAELTDAKGLLAQVSQPLLVAPR